MDKFEWDRENDKVAGEFERIMLQLGNNANNMIIIFYFKY
jgi:hypothetical protein